jgi:hypothetical protein
MQDILESEYKDWGEISLIFDELKLFVQNKDLSNASEAQTRFDVIDRIIREILQWKHGQIKVEERTNLFERGFVDYLLRSRDITIIIEAKKIGASFPSPSRVKKLKLGGVVLSSKEIAAALLQAEEYALNKKAQIVVATNGECWCFYALGETEKRQNIQVNVLFPFEIISHAEELFNFLSCPRIELNGIHHISSDITAIKERKIINVVRDSDLRLDRNNIADFIQPALDDALYNESFITDAEKLKYCFVSTDTRKKFDKAMNVYLEECKPTSILPAKRIKKQKSIDEFHEEIKKSNSKTFPPITLLMGSVGAGKTTYLKHFEMVKAKDEIRKEGIHWVYIDFEEMGIDGIPRTFLYKKLLDYLLAEHPDNPTDYKNAIEPAYEEHIKALARGPFSKIFKNKEKFDEKVLEIIETDYKLVEPYVDKLFSYIATKSRCVIILDNIDLYEREDLETRVLSEGIALSKKLRCHILISIRDTTFVSHKNDSIFNAFEQKKLWLDPPPFREVLAKRLLYARKTLKNVNAKIPFTNNMTLDIPDLSVFFEIVQKSLLSETSGNLIENISDRNIRKGINLVRNFLTSGHVRADFALKKYLNREEFFSFPIHEVFKGAMLGPWKHYKEERSEACNLFDSKIPSARLLLLRFYLLKYLFIKAHDSQTTSIKVSELIDLFSKIGASESDICFNLNSLKKFELLNSKDASPINKESIVYITLSGAYYISYLSQVICYHDAVMMDTPIYDDQVFDSLVSLSHAIEHEHSIVKRLELRRDRNICFLNYLREIEKKSLHEIMNNQDLFSFEKISSRISRELKNIIQRQIQYSKH